MGGESPPGPCCARVWPVLMMVWLLGSTGGCSGGSHDDGVGATTGVAPGTWAVLGSSTAAGIGAPADSGWVALLRAARQPDGVVTHNLARSGLLTSQALPAGTSLPGRAPPDPSANIDRALAVSPKLVILAFPSNDVLAGVPASEIVGHWQLIQQRAGLAGATTIVLSTQPRDGADAVQRATLAETDRLAAVAFGPCFVDVRTALADAQGNIASALSAGDGVHLNAQGHRVVFERVNAVLASGACVRLSG